MIFFCEAERVEVGDVLGYYDTSTRTYEYAKVREINRLDSNILEYYVQQYGTGLTYLRGWCSTNPSVYPTCRNCHRVREEHGAGQQCLFSPTTFEGP